jgi:acyl-coenzyme A thioesterase PaaI-like protein
MTATDRDGDAPARKLVDGIRELMLAAAITDVDAAAMARAQRLVSDASILLQGAVRETGRRLPMDSAAIARVQGGAPWQVFTHNPMGIPLRIKVRGSDATAEVQPSALFEGPPGILHGGFSAAMLDALLSTLIQAQDVKAVTVALDVAFTSAVSVAEPLIVGGTITEVTGRKIIADGWIRSGDRLAVTGRAVFITVPGEPD